MPDSSDDTIEIQRKPGGYALIRGGQTIATRFADLDSAIVAAGKLVESHRIIIRQ